METKESFIVNECILAIKALADKNPNDMSLGAEVREFINSLKKDN